MKNQNVPLQEFYDNNYFIHLAGHCDFHLVTQFNINKLNII
jgi:hypothetical protein